VDSKVFISHSTKDKIIANAVCEHLEAAGIDCWIAPRNIEAGADWTEGIMRGLARSQVFVLLFSGHANDSEHVRREVGKAFSLRLPVIPFRIEAIEPRGSFAYFLDSVQWLDATKPPLEPYFTVLTERVKWLLTNGAQSELRSPLVPEKKLQSPIAPARKNGRWLPAVLLAGTAAIIACGVSLFIANKQTASESESIAQNVVVPAKSVAVLPFESLSENKDDAYFADGVQDDILNNLAKIADLTVISRTSVMQYRAGTKRDLPQIAKALGVANVLEGTVRRNANRVRVSAELIDARQDKSTWADSFDRDLTDIFTIQSEVAQTIAAKLAATLLPGEKQNIERRPTENLEAYDRYLKARQLLTIVRSTYDSGDVRKPLVDAVDLLEQAVRLDPKFTLAYCASAEAHDFLYRFGDPSPQQLALGDEAVERALELQPDLPEVRLAYAFHLYQGHRDYEGARAQLAIARRGLPNDTEAMSLEASMDRRRGQFEKAIQAFKDAVARDPQNSDLVEQLAFTLQQSRHFREAEQMFDRLVELVPDQPILKTRKPLFYYLETGDDSPVRAAIAAFPPSLADDKDALCFKLDFACFARDWSQAKEILGKLKGGDDEGDFAYGQMSVPLGCYSILISRFQTEPPGANPSFAETREQLNQTVQKSSRNAPLLSQLAVVDALLDNKDTAIAEAEKAVEMLPTSEDAMEGPCLELNLAVVYAWANELDLAFEKLSSLTKVANGIFYGQLKWDPLWEPLRHDPRYEKLVAELAPRLQEVRGEQ
jgi:TolB-like protein